MGTIEIPQCSGLRPTAPFGEYTRRSGAHLDSERFSSLPSRVCSHFGHRLGINFARQRTVLGYLDRLPQGKKSRCLGRDTVEGSNGTLSVPMKLSVVTCWFAVIWICAGVPRVVPTLP